MIHIAYFSELNLQVCNYAQKRRICHENCKYVLDERFHGHFSPAESLPSPTTLVSCVAKRKGKQMILSPTFKGWSHSRNRASSCWRGRSSVRSLPPTGGTRTGARRSDQVSPWLRSCPLPSSSHLLPSLKFWYICFFLHFKLSSLTIPAVSRLLAFEQGWAWSLILGYSSPKQFIHTIYMDGFLNIIRV